MSCAVVWSSKTGNTELLARSIVEFMGDDCVYAGGPSSDALGADRVYVGFWTDKGSCDESIAAFLTALDSQEVFLFGTAGFGGSGAYFEQILTKVRALIPDTATVVGTFMCQGKMGAGPASYGMTDTMGRMHSDAQFAGSSSVPAHVDMMGLIGMGNNPMVGATVACAVAVNAAINE